KLRKLKKDLRTQGKRLEELESEQSNLQMGLSRHRDILSSQIRASYIMGHQEQLKLLLNQSDPSQVQRTVAYYDYLNRSRAQQIKTVIEKLERLQKIETTISLEREKQKQLYGQRRQERKQLEEKRRHRTVLLARLDHEIQNKDKRLNTMLENEKELKDLLQALEKALSDIPPDTISQQPFSSLKGKLSWPTRGKISKRFGKRRNMGNLRWKGVVISAPMGSNVHAISHGRVAFADWLRGYGLIIIIDHGNGYMSLYGQNQHLLKETGEWVEAGEIIASVGDSGGQANTGLYFELRRQGKPVNPMKWCKKTSKGLVGLNYQ
ncbi:MAG: peptidoglycan DD-metalloendopeptidase family protein, partial [Gammaproteobacteria bacterium]|nr:peptidoglycan DD-metalloendopeptidase family protein [Gammaproteobacteria bacterium]